MTALAQKKALEVMKARVVSINARYDGYHAELTEALHDILTIVKDRPHNIAQQVSRKVSALGENLIQKKGNLE